MASPVVKLTNKLRHTQNYIRNGARQAICVILNTCLFYKTPRIEIRWFVTVNCHRAPPGGSAGHRSTTPKFVTPTALSCIDNSWRSTTLSLPKKLTSPTANLEWCHVHSIRDSYSTFIHQVIGPSKNFMESFFNAKFDFTSTCNRDSTTSHHKYPVCQSPVGDANVWSMYFGTNRIIDNWHRCLGVMWRKRKNYFDI